MIGNEEFKLKMQSIGRGNAIWKRIYDELHISSKDITIFFPETQNEKLNYRICELLPVITERRNVDRLIIICDKNAKGIMENVLKANYRYLDEGEIDDLLNCYKAYDFGYNFYLAGIECPVGRVQMSVLKKYNISLDEMIINGIFGLNEGETNGFEININHNIDAYSNSFSS